MNAYTQPPAGRVPPHNIEAEQALLGAILINNDAWHAVGGHLTAEHFVEEIHRRIWEVASTLIREGRVASPITLKTFLGDHDLGGITVPHYLARLAAEATTIINAVDFASMIVDLAARRRLIGVGQELVEVAFDAPVGHSPERILEDAETALMDVRSRELAHIRTTRLGAGAAAFDVLAHLDRVRSGEARDTGVRIGLPSIDQDTGGIRPGDLWVVAGRASMGKSVFATAIALGAARGGAGTLLWPLEIGRQQAAARLLSAMAYSGRHPVGYGAILRGDVDDEVRLRLDDAAQRLDALPLVLDVAESATLPAIAARMRAERDRMARRGVRLGVTILDYVAFVNASDKYRGQRVHEIGEISVGLKQLAKSLDTGIVLLAQVSRKTEDREDKRPTISDLRDSGNLEQDADVVALLYRENYYIERSTAFQSGNAAMVVQANETRNEIEVIIAKNRTGATRSHKLWCDMGASLISARAREVV